jgi:Cu-Zn family superoxide dismutase
MCLFSKAKIVCVVFNHFHQIKKVKMKQIIQTIQQTGFFLLVFCAIISCNSNTNSEKSTGPSSDSTASTEAAPMKEHAVADLKPVFQDTALSGSAEFDAEAGGKVKMKLHLSVPAKANKSVAVHIHANGDCGDMGKAAGGHWNPTNVDHGKWGNAPFHSGDIGNVKLDMNGNGDMELETDLWSLGGDAKTNILNKAIIVHGGEDDFVSQPSGNAGTRIGCGVIN